MSRREKKKRKKENTDINELTTDSQRRTACIQEARFDSIHHGWCVIFTRHAPTTILINAREY